MKHAYIPLYASTLPQPASENSFIEQDRAFADRAKFILSLSQMETAQEILAFMRDTLDTYRAFGGDPLHWIDTTLEDMKVNFPNYPAAHRGQMEKHLLDWRASAAPVLHYTAKKVPDRYYALLHCVLIYLGKESQIGHLSKTDIINLGKQKYGTGQGFYKEIREVDLLNIATFVRSIPQKDRARWKETISDISGRDADVISWLRKQPK